MAQVLPFLISGRLKVFHRHFSKSSSPPQISRVKLAKFSAKLVANFRRSLEGDFRASFAGENVRSIFHQNSTANFTIKLHYAVLGCGGPYSCQPPQICKNKIFSSPGRSAGVATHNIFQGPLNGGGGVSNGGVSRSGFPDRPFLSFFVLFVGLSRFFWDFPDRPFLSFLGLSRFFWDFPDLLGDGPGISPICPFPPCSA